ncbi:MAG: glycerate kinase [Verrucomicrobiota bacterium]
MALRILIIPDKFKGTLTAQAAAKAIAAGWKSSRPEDALELLPMSDGGDGFGEIVSRLIGARPRKIRTVDAAHQPIHATWWWDRKSKTAVIESAKIVGLAMMPPKNFHPFQLDTFGLGNVLHATEKLGCRKCVIGIGGSATNDAGFGLARALGWQFLDKAGGQILCWTALDSLAQIVAPRRLRVKVIVAVDVQNPLLGPCGATRVYGPQKGLRAKDFLRAENALSRLARISRRDLGADFAKVPGAGAAGGLGFGLLAFLGAQPESGFEIFAHAANLKSRLGKTDLVLTGEGALDQQTLMGKGVGQVARLCRTMKIPCIGIAGVVLEPKKAKKLFSQTHGLTEITSAENAKAHPAKFLEKLATQIATGWHPGPAGASRPSWKCD